MITLRVDEKALETVLDVAFTSDGLTQQERMAILHVATQAAKGVADKIESSLEMEIGNTEGVPI